MSIKSNIRKLLFISLWIVIGSGTLILLIAAIRSRNDKTCQGIAIQVNGEKKGKWLLDRNDIINNLTSNGTEKIKGRALQSFDLRRLEEKLKKHVWIRDAELFFDNNEVLQVRLYERQPLARLFTSNGNSFYLDHEGKKLPLSERLTLKLPVFTGFPYEKNDLKKADSVLLAHVMNVSRFIINDSFWMAQIAQVDITPARKFEMVPTVGNHIIEFGSGENADKKFNKLMIFYTTVLNQVGLNRYERINVEYNQQILGIKKTMMVSKADSIRAVKNIRELIESAQQLQKAIADSADLAKPSNPIEAAVNPEEAKNRTIQKNQTVKPKPKATMPARI
jgi:cell division protein FtsQ